MSNYNYSNNFNNNFNNNGYNTGNNNQIFSGRDVNIGDIKVNSGNNSTISINTKYGREVDDAIKQVSNKIGNSNDEARKLLNDFVMELKETQPERNRLKDIWSRLEKSLPAVNGITDVVTKIYPLFSP